MFISNSNYFLIKYLYIITIWYKIIYVKLYFLEGKYMINYLEKLKEKCIVNKEFYNIVEDIFNKLLEFGYTTPKKVKKLQKNYMIILMLFYLAVMLRLITKLDTMIL